MPEPPMATSVMPRRHARPKESETITGPSTPRRSSRTAPSLAALLSGSRGRRQTVSSPGTFEASTPALAQTKPWRVSEMTTPRSMRTTRRLSRKTTSIWRGSFPHRDAYSLASGEGSTVLRSTRRPSALLITLWVTTSTSPGRRTGPTASATSPSRSSPGRTSGKPSTGMSSTLFTPTSGPPFPVLRQVPGRVQVEGEVPVLADPRLGVAVAGGPEVGLEAIGAEEKGQDVRRPEVQGVRARAGPVRGDHDRRPVGGRREHIPDVFGLDQGQVRRKDEQGRRAVLRRPRAPLLQRGVQPPALLRKRGGALLEGLVEHYRVGADHPDRVDPGLERPRDDAAHHVEREAGAGRGVEHGRQPALGAAQVLDGHHRVDAPGARHAPDPAPNSKTSRARRARSSGSRIMASVA